MGENTAIEWADHTFNPWIGCTKVSPACDHCYAEAWDARGLQGQPTRWGPHASRTRTSAANWRKPLAWNRQAEDEGRRYRVFCASLADVFDNHRSIENQWRDDLWKLIYATPHLDWLLLTKRPQNIAKMLPDHYGAPAWGDGWPNIWLGTTVENQEEADRRIPVLLSIPAKVHFLSCEPLLGPVDLTELERPEWPGTGIFSALECDVDPADDGEWGGRTIKWVICGGESGPGARPMHPDWARSLRDQCQAAGVPFLFKQWGEWVSVYDRDRDDPDWQNVPKPGDWDRKRWLNLAGGQGFHGDHLNMMRRVGKKAAGRMLDGRTWDEVSA